MDGPHSLSGGFGGAKHILHLPVFEAPFRTARSLFAGLFRVLPLLSKVVINVSMSAVRCLCFILKEPEFSRQIVVRITNQKSPVNPSSVQWDPICSKRAVGRTRRFDEANSAFLNCCANALSLKVH